ncbi:deoxyribonuclease IV [Anaerocolumna xylanovorans]|uniref:Probable endonuclease 4 n=1 Tax=Anaerocolumna xylanovorans DSM 12503 TaxID=1121345 RepID=A0A1M7Y8C1_9FIRM|nr:deoxyribonuclease IV [Anaerocolumna xylanovorans]SHO48867.1 Endonuclease IV [Anaerocolumna xylanovorans DSM 12503]
MLKIGTHLSVAKGYERMGKDALLIGANTLQFFARNPRGAKAKVPDYIDMSKFKELMEKNNFTTIMAHAPYTLNACSSNSHLRELSARMFAEDLERMEYFPGSFYNFHPGSRLGQEEEEAIKQIADMLNQVMSKDMHTTVLLETMAGKGSEMGRRFEEIQEVLKRVRLQDKVGVCMDACHMWNAGYDVAEELDKVVEEFDRVIGIQKLKAFHLNDSMDGRGDHKDRHARIGMGSMGAEATKGIINHPKLKDLVFILETPTDLPGHREEIDFLKSAYQW